MGNRRFASVLSGIAVAVGVFSAANQVRAFVCSVPATLIHQTAQHPDPSKPIRKQSGVDLVKLSDLAESGVEGSASNAVPVDVRADTRRAEWPATITSSTQPVYRQQLMVTQQVLRVAIRATFGARARQDILMQGWGGLAQGVAHRVEPWVQKNRSKLQPVAANPRPDDIASMVRLLER